LAIKFQQDTHRRRSARGSKFLVLTAKQLADLRIHKMNLRLSELSLPGGLLFAHCLWLGIAGAVKKESQSGLPVAGSCLRRRLASEDKAACGEAG
jgi:hypothetical protein